MIWVSGHRAVRAIYDYEFSISLVSWHEMLARNGRSQLPIQINPVAQAAGAVHLRKWEISILDRAGYMPELRCLHRTDRLWLRWSLGGIGLLTLFEKWGTVTRNLVFQLRGSTYKELKLASCLLQSLCLFLQERCDLEIGKLIRRRLWDRLG